MILTFISNALLTTAKEFSFLLNCAAPARLGTEMVQITVVVVVVDLVRRIIVTAPLWQNGSGAICKSDQNQTFQCFNKTGDKELLCLKSLLNNNENKQGSNMKYKMKTLYNVGQK